MTATPCECEQISRRVSCGKPAIGRYAAMCVHEHRREAAMCFHHAARAASGESFCATCWDGPERHRCPLAGLTELERAA
jgi:hypothetical protein